MESGNRPLKSNWHEMKSLMSKDTADLDDFGDLMFVFITYVRPQEVYGRVCWWMDKEKHNLWRSRGITVRNKIRLH